MSDMVFTANYMTNANRKRKWELQTKK